MNTTMVTLYLLNFIMCAESLRRYIHYMINQERLGICIKLTKQSENWTYNVCWWLFDFLKSKEGCKEYYMYFGSLFQGSKLINYHKSKVHFSKGIIKQHGKKSRIFSKLLQLLVPALNLVVLVLIAKEPMLTLKKSRIKWDRNLQVGILVYCQMQIKSF